MSLQTMQKSSIQTTTHWRLPVGFCVTVREIWCTSSVTGKQVNA